MPVSVPQSYHKDCWKVVLLAVTQPTPRAPPARHPAACRQRDGKGLWRGQRLTVSGQGQSISSSLMVECFRLLMSDTPWAGSETRTMSLWGYPQVAVTSFVGPSPVHSTYVPDYYPAAAVVQWSAELLGLRLEVSGPGNQEFRYIAPSLHFRRTVVDEQ